MELKPNSPLAKLNDLFPAGIPTVSNEPNLLVMNQECWQLNLEGLSKQQFQQIAAIVLQDVVPLPIQAGLLFRGILAIPNDWVSL